MKKKIISCQSCNQKLRIPDIKKRLKIRCTSCSKEFYYGTASRLSKLQRWILHTIRFNNYDNERRFIFRKYLISRYIGYRLKPIIAQIKKEIEPLLTRSIKTLGDRDLLKGYYYNQDLKKLLNSDRINLLEITEAGEKEAMINSRKVKKSEYILLNDKQQKIKNLFRPAGKKFRNTKGRKDIYKDKVILLTM